MSGGATARTFPFAALADDAYTGGTAGDPHPVVFILSINLSSH